MQIELLALDSNTLNPIRLAYVLSIYIDKIKENGFKVTKESRRCLTQLPTPTKPMT